MPQTPSTHPDVRHTRRKWDHDAGFHAWCAGQSYQEIADAAGVRLESAKARKRDLDQARSRLYSQAR